MIYIAIFVFFVVIIVASTKHLYIRKTKKIIHKKHNYK